MVAGQHRHFLARGNQNHHLDSPLRGNAGAIVQTLGDGHIIKRLALVVLGVLLWDQGADFFKHWIARPRPCQTMDDLRVLVHCSPYGFFSAHAANAFGLAFLFRKWLHPSWFPVLLIIALLQSYSRIHLGVHYPTDLLVGALWGFLISFVLHKIEKTWS